jgi:hypothetical protein
LRTEQFILQPNEKVKIVPKGTGENVTVKVPYGGIIGGIEIDLDQSKSIYMNTFPPLAEDIYAYNTISSEIKVNVLFYNEGEFVI